jgi:fructokinase
MSSKSKDEQILVAIEAGGTTWAAAIAYCASPDHPFDEIEVPTNIDPRVTISEIRKWFRAKNSEYSVAAVGIASFGPIDPKKSSPTFGFITSTPKPGWGNTDVVGMLGFVNKVSSAQVAIEYDCLCDGEFSHIPFLFDTDVNAPALAEFLHYKKCVDAGLTSSCYVTVGTGVGAGLVVNGQTVSGLLHPEAGHIPVQRLAGDDYQGCCPFHKCCLEGMVCSRALSERAGCDASALASLPDDHPMWDTVAYYLAQLAVNLVMITSIERISYGGGIFNRVVLFDKIRKHLKSLMNGYIQNDALTTDAGLEKFVSESVWGANSGLIGTLFLASEAQRRSHAR